MARPSQARVGEGRRRGRRSDRGSAAALGELENTLILFTSDNGFLQGEHRIPGGKINVYERKLAKLRKCKGRSCRRR